MAKEMTEFNNRHRTSSSSLNEMQTGMKILLHNTLPCEQRHGQETKPRT